MTRCSQTTRPPGRDLVEQDQPATSNCMGGPRGGGWGGGGVGGVCAEAKSGQEPIDRSHCAAARWGMRLTLELELERALELGLPLELRLGPGLGLRLGARVGWSGRRNTRWYCWCGHLVKRDVLFELTAFTSQFVFDQHGSFDLLRFRPGPVHTSVGHLVAPRSREVTILMPNLVGHPMGIEHCSPELLGSSNPPASASPVAETTGARHRGRPNLSLKTSL